MLSPHNKWVHFQAKVVKTVATLIVAGSKTFGNEINGDYVTKEPKTFYPIVKYATVTPPLKNLPRTYLTLNFKKIHPALDSKHSKLIDHGLHPIWTYSDVYLMSFEMHSMGSISSNSDLVRKHHLISENELKRMQILIE